MFSFGMPVLEYGAPTAEADPSPFGGQRGFACGEPGRHQGQDLT
jgi:hypothetical protein